MKASDGIEAKYGVCIDHMQRFENHEPMIKALINAFPNKKDSTKSIDGHTYVKYYYQGISQAYENVVVTSDTDQVTGQVKTDQVKMLGGDHGFNNVGKDAYWELCTGERMPKKSINSYLVLFHAQAKVNPIPFPVSERDAQDLAKAVVAMVFKDKEGIEKAKKALNNIEKAAKKAPPFKKEVDNIIIELGGTPDSPQGLQALAVAASQAAAQLPTAQVPIQAPIQAPPIPAPIQAPPIPLQAPIQAPPIPVHTSALGKRKISDGFKELFENRKHIGERKFKQLHKQLVEKLKHQIL